jgi:hypothetical protein
MKEKTTRERLGVNVALLVGLLVLVCTVGAFAGSAGAVQENETNVSDKAPYYADNTSAVDNESWMEGHREPSLANILHYSTRFSSFVVGTGSPSQGGAGFTGPLITGMLVYGAVIAGMYQSGIGPVGGSVTMVVASFGLTTAGLAPMWVFAVGLFGIGGVLAWVLRRALR